MNLAFMAQTAIRDNQVFPVGNRLVRAQVQGVLADGRSISADRGLGAEPFFHSADGAIKSVEKAKPFCASSAARRSVNARWIIE
jgi:hypothetical protein